MGTTWTPIAALLAVLATDVWVLRDARRRDAAGHDLVASVGPLTLSTPEQWFLACLLFWVFFFPLYLVARRA